MKSRGKAEFNIRDEKILGSLAGRVFDDPEVKAVYWVAGTLGVQFNETLVEGKLQYWKNLNRKRFKHVTKLCTMLTSRLRYGTVILADVGTNFDLRYEIEIEELIESKYPVPRNKKSRIQNFEVGLVDGFHDYWYVSPVRKTNMETTCFWGGLPLHTHRNISSHVDSGSHDPEAFGGYLLLATDEEFTAIAESIRRRENNVGYRIAVEFTGDGMGYLWNDRNCPDHKRGKTTVQALDKLTLQMYKAYHERNRDSVAPDALLTVSTPQAGVDGP